jgi:Recombination endonuclease VII
MKRCKKCKILKPLAEFYGAKGARDGRRSECKACSLANRKWYRDNRDRAISYVRAWQQANPDRVKAWRVRNRERRNEQMREIHLRNKFGLTPDEYDRILSAQGGVCVLCDRPPTPGISLHVDHDHGTGEIRGLLCMRCNNALGLCFKRIPISCGARLDMSLPTRSIGRSERAGRGWPDSASRRCEGVRRRLRIWQGGSSAGPGRGCIPSPPWRRDACPQPT